MGPTTYPGLAGNITGMATGRVASADSALLYRPSGPPLYCMWSDHTLLHRNTVSVKLKRKAVV